MNIIDGPHGEFALRLHQERNRLNLTQEQLGELVGIDKRTISLYENGRSFPRKETLKRLAEKLGIEMLWLATGVNAATKEILANEYQRSKGKTIKEVALLRIESWTELIEPSLFGGKQFNTTGSEKSENLHEVVPVIKTLFDNYRATRMPNVNPPDPIYPAGSILVIDAGTTTIDRIASGTDVIFRFIDNKSEPGLRRLVREHGFANTQLVSTNPSLQAAPIEVNDDEIVIIGTVLWRIVSCQPSTEFN